MGRRPREETHKKIYDKMAFTMRSPLGLRNSQERRASSIVPAAPSSSSRDGPPATLSASAAGDMVIADRHFASTSSVMTSELEIATQQTPKETIKDVARRITYDEDSDISTDRDRVNDLRDPDAVMDLSDDVFETPTADTEVRWQKGAVGAAKARRVLSNPPKTASSKARPKRKATERISPGSMYDNSQYKSTATVAALIDDLTDTIESTRLRSKNLNGPMSHTIKLCVQKIKKATADLATRSELAGDPSYTHSRETELVRQTSELKSENIRLREQLEALRAEFRQFKQDVHDGKIGMGLKSPKQSRDIATSPLDLPTYSAVSIPAGSRATNIALVGGTETRHFPFLQQMPRKYTSLSSQSRMLSCIEENKEQPPRPQGKKLQGRGLSEEEREISDQPTASDTEWSVAGSRRRRRRIRSAKTTSGTNNVSALHQTNSRKERQANQRSPRVRPPRLAAVAIRIPDGKMSYADAMKRARREVDLEHLDLGDTRIRRDVTGGLLIQIPGKEKKEKARQLQSKLQEVFGEDVRVTIPSKRAEVRITGFDDSVTSEEILGKISTIGECSKTDIRMGPIRSLPNGLCAVWLQCPIDSIQKLVKQGRIRLGWTSAKVILLPLRRLQCFKCLEFGHVKATCPSDEDRSNLCYRCGEVGHKASACSNRMRCPICASRGQKAEHRIGSYGCSAKTTVGINKRNAVPGPSANSVGHSADPVIAATEGEREVQEDPMMDTETCV